MTYKGKYNIFNLGLIKTYPLKTRNNKIKIKDIIQPLEIREINFELTDDYNKNIDNIKNLANIILSSRKENKPVILFTGAHLIKNGLGLLVIDLIKNNLITHVAGNCATAIHDFELALIGETSEDVPKSLEKGKFGMAYEFCYINTAISLGNAYNLGLGESLGKMICEESFKNEILAKVSKKGMVNFFLYPDLSILAICYKKNIPFTIHTGIGTDVIDQHPSFNGEAKGGCSGRDFLIYVNEISKLFNGGVILNIGSAVTGPEVLLKAVSMASNIGKKPERIITADFDIRQFADYNIADESSQYYYFRDQKSIVTRIPEAFNGKGYYIQGNQKTTIPLLYKEIINKL